jgi:hypothetical protein
MAVVLTCPGGRRSVCTPADSERSQRLEVPLSAKGRALLLAGSCPASRMVNESCRQSAKRSPFEIDVRAHLCRASHFKPAAVISRRGSGLLDRLRKVIDQRVTCISAMLCSHSCRALLARW